MAMLKEFLRNSASRAPTGANGSRDRRLAIWKISEVHAGSAETSSDTMLSSGRVEEQHCGRVQRVEFIIWTGIGVIGALSVVAFYILWAKAAGG
jgi:hypothetical protein